MTQSFPSTFWPTETGARRGCDGNVASHFFRLMWGSWVCWASVWYFAPTSNFSCCTVGFPAPSPRPSMFSSSWPNTSSCSSSCAFYVSDSKLWLMTSFRPRMKIPGMRYFGWSRGRGWCSWSSFCKWRPRSSSACSTIIFWSGHYPASGCHRSTKTWKVGRATSRLAIYGTGWLWPYICWYFRCTWRATTTTSSISRGTIISFRSFLLSSFFNLQFISSTPATQTCWIRHFSRTPMTNLSIEDTLRWNLKSAAARCSLRVRPIKTITISTAWILEMYQKERDRSAEKQNCKTRTAPSACSHWVNVERENRKMRCFIRRPVNTDFIRGAWRHGWLLRTKSNVQYVGCMCRKYEK